MKGRLGGVPDRVVSPVWRAYLEWWDQIKDYRKLTYSELNEGRHLWEAVLEEADAGSMTPSQLAARVRKTALDGVENCLSGMMDLFDFDGNCHGDRMTFQNTTQETIVILKSQEAILRALLCILKESR